MNTKTTLRSSLVATLLGAALLLPATAFAGKGASYRRKFTRAGTYTYLCALHPGMRGKVVVASAGR